jgi:hypothetical protein
MVAGSNPIRRGISKGDKNPQHTFLRMRSKAGVHRFYGMLKICWRVSLTDMQNSHSFVCSSYLRPDDSAGRTSRDLWWTSQEFCPASSLPWLPTLTYQLAGWTIGPLMAAVLRRVTPSTQSITSLHNHPGGKNLTLHNCKKKHIWICTSDYYKKLLNFLHLRRKYLYEKTKSPSAVTAISIL